MLFFIESDLLRPYVVWLGFQGRTEVERSVAQTALLTVLIRKLSAGKIGGDCAEQANSVLVDV
jgi:hypothetical protein